MPWTIPESELCLILAPPLHSYLLTFVSNMQNGGIDSPYFTRG